VAFKQWKTEICGRELTVETGKLAKQSAGSAYIRMGDTVVLVVANASKNPKGGDFLPLTVEFMEKYYSAGKIPGGFLKREGRPGDTSILAARQIDRPIRPLFPEGFSNEVQVIATVFSLDEDNPADIIGILGASMALNFSYIPFEGIVSGVKVAYLDGKPVVFPTAEQLENSLIDLTVAGSEEAIVMVEGEAKEVSEDVMLEALAAAHETIKEICQFQSKILAEMELPEKMEFEVPSLPDEDKEKFNSIIDIEELRKCLFTSGKKAAEKAISSYKEEVMEKFFEEMEEEEIAEKSMLVSGLFEDTLKKVMRRSIVEDKKRSDGRSPTQIRNIVCETSLLPRAHGSSLFTRGETQSLGIVTLGSKRDVQFVDTIYEQSDKHFMLHYNFPGFSVGEVKPQRGISRREVGHGHLAERSVKFIVPGHEEFPYAIRVVSEILESNGSSSMATICSASMSLMDAGVPVKKHVAGVAMGMILESDGVEVLTDILGLEDHLGDMDFKVAGTREGITGFQMDVKVSGISQEIMAKALQQAKDARMHILGLMYDTIDKPRDEMSPYAPVMLKIQIPLNSIGDLIGPGGKTIKGIIKEYDVDLDVEDETGMVYISGENSEKALKAKAFVEGITKKIEAGEEYNGKITRVEKYGVFVELAPGKVGLLHVSNMVGFVKDPSQTMHIGDRVEIVVGKVESDGKFELRQKGAEERKKRDGNDRRPPRRNNRPERKKERESGE